MIILNPVKVRTMSEPNPDLKRRYDAFMAVPEQRHRYQMLCLKFPVLSMVDNNFAYHACLQNKYKMFENCKVTNFVPTYDKWCLYCDDRGKPKKTCSRCKSVFFCDTTCQKKAWKIHKKHCGQDLFRNCACCGTIITEAHRQNSWHKCEKCPVKFCSPKCRKTLYEDHKMVDCDYFAKTFNGLQNN